MAKRKSLNRRSARYSRSSFGSGYLDPDTNIIDPDQPLWWTNLENNTINRLSTNTTQLVNYTNSLLNSNSTVRSIRGSSEWWKELEMSNPTVLIPPQDTPDTTKDATNDIADSSLSESEKDARVLRKKKSLRILPRRSQGNSAFLLALEHSENLDTSRSEQKDKQVKVTSKSKTTALSESIVDEPLNENHDNSSNSGSVVLKSKPRILEKAVHNRTDNVFHDLLTNEPLNENPDNSSDSSSVILKPKARILQNAVHNHSDNVFQELLVNEGLPLKQSSDNHLSSQTGTSKHTVTIEAESNEHSTVNKSKTPEVHSLRVPDDESINLSTPNAHSSTLKSGHSSVAHSDDDDSKTHTNVVIPKSRFMRRTRKSSTSNIFENVLAAECSVDTENRVEGVRRSARLTEARQVESTSKVSNTLEKSSIDHVTNRMSQTIAQSPGRHRKSNSLLRTKNKDDFANTSAPTMENISAEQDPSSPHTIRASYRGSELVVPDDKAASRTNKSVTSQRRLLKRSSPTKRISTAGKKRSSQSLQKSVNDDSDSSWDNVSSEEDNVDVINHGANDIELTQLNIPSPKRKRSNSKFGQDVSTNEETLLKNKPVGTANGTDLQNCEIMLEDLSNKSSKKLMTKPTEVKNLKKDMKIDLKNCEVMLQDCANVSSKKEMTKPTEVKNLKKDKSIEKLNSEIMPKIYKEKMTDLSFIKNTQFTDSESDEEITTRPDESESKAISTSNLSTPNRLNKSETRVTSTLKTNVQPVDTHNDNHVSKVSKESEKRTKKSNVLKSSRSSVDASAENVPSRSEKNKSGTSRANTSKVAELFADSNSDEDILNITTKSSSRALSTNVSGIFQTSRDLVNNEHTPTPKKRLTKTRKSKGSTVKQVQEDIDDAVDTPKSFRGHKQRRATIPTKSARSLTKAGSVNTESASNLSETSGVEKDTGQFPKLSKNRNLIGRLTESTNKVSELNLSKHAQANLEGIALEANVSRKSTFLGHDKNESKKSKGAEGRVSKSNRSKTLHTPPPTSSSDTVESEHLNAKTRLSKLSISNVLQTPPFSDDDKHSLAKSQKSENRMLQIRVESGSYSSQISNDSRRVSTLPAQVGQQVSALSPEKRSQTPSKVDTDPDDETLFKVPQITPFKGRRSSVQKMTLPHSVLDDDNASVTSKNLRSTSPTSSATSSIRLRIESDSETNANLGNNKGVLNAALKQPVPPLKPTISENYEHSSDDRQGREELSASRLLPIAHSSGVADSLVAEPENVATPRESLEEKKTKKKQSTTARFPGKEKDASLTEIRSVTKKISSTQKNMQDFLKPKQSKASQPASDGPSSSEAATEEKLSGVKKELERIRLQEIEHMKMDKKPEPEKRVFSKKSVLKKKILESKENVSTKPAKEATSSPVVSNKMRKRPKLFRPKPWATDKLYHHLWKCMEPKYKSWTKPRSEKFVRGLAEVIKIVNRRKKYDSYKTEVDILIKEMARLKIIRTRNDFYLFCQEFLPFSFRIKVTPILLPGNKRTIPYDPSKLHTPIIEA